MAIKKNEQEVMFQMSRAEAELSILLQWSHRKQKSPGRNFCREVTVPLYEPEPWLQAEGLTARPVISRGFLPTSAVLLRSLQATLQVEGSQVSGEVPTGFVRTLLRELQIQLGPAVTFPLLTGVRDQALHLRILQL
jgi:hypothetical protein